MQGGTQALSRSLFASLIPREQVGRVLRVLRDVREVRRDLRPGVFAGDQLPHGLSRGSIIAIIGFFVVGGLLLAFVDVKEGQRVARAEDKAAEVDPLREP